jgi:hypothetical protein
MFEGRIPTHATCLSSTLPDFNHPMGTYGLSSRNEDLFQPSVCNHGEEAKSLADFLIININ